jgi:hypothetical protein
MQLTAAFMYIDLVLRNVASFLYFCDSIDRFCAFVSNSVTDNYITHWTLLPFLLFYGLTNPISQDNSVLTSRKTFTTELEIIRKEGHGMIPSTIKEFVWRDWGNHIEPQYR